MTRSRWLQALAISLWSATGSGYLIHNANELIEFSNMVNSGKNSFSGWTVFLDADIELPVNPPDPSQHFEMIGNNTRSNGNFRGTFDGQGHVISNLVVNSSGSPYVGMFGYAGYGMTVRNLVLDSSCSVTSTYGTSGSQVGGFIGYCKSLSGPCIVENSINMGDVRFSENASRNGQNIGGFVGHLFRYKSYEGKVKNCANYGAVTHSGVSSNLQIGGLVGYPYGGEDNAYAYIQNSLNYGTITHSGETAGSLNIGGIAGECYLTHIDNCVSAGKISTGSGTARYTYLGGITGNGGIQITSSIATGPTTLERTRLSALGLQ